MELLRRYRFIGEEWDGKILLDFHPLKISNEPDWNPMWEEWHCYAKPLRVFQQDYQLLLGYFNKIYPTKDAFDGTNETFFDLNEKVNGYF